MMQTRKHIYFPLILAVIQPCLFMLQRTTIVMITGFSTSFECTLLITVVNNLKLNSNFRIKVRISPTGTSRMMKVLFSAPRTLRPCMSSTPTFLSWWLSRDFWWPIMVRAFCHRHTSTSVSLIRTWRAGSCWHRTMCRWATDVMRPRRWNVHFLTLWL